MCATHLHELGEDYGHLPCVALRASTDNAEVYCCAVCVVEVQVNGMKCHHQRNDERTNPINVAQARRPCGWLFDARRLHASVNFGRVMRAREVDGHC